MRAFSTIAFLVATASIAAAQPRRPPVADPLHAHLVEGRVVDASGAPIAGAFVERVTGAADDTPFSRGAYRTTTDAQGAFRFSFRGIGVSTGRTWYLAVRRAGQPVVIETVSLDRRVVPGVGREGDVATGVVIRVP
jgi:hypothetical protein